MWTLKGLVFMIAIIVDTIITSARSDGVYVLLFPVIRLPVSVCLVTKMSTKWIDMGSPIRLHT